MFIPFLPMILALLAAALVHGEPAGARALSGGWSALAAGAAYLALCLLLGRAAPAARSQLGAGRAAGGGRAVGGEGAAAGAGTAQDGVDRTAASAASNQNASAAPNADAAAGAGGDAERPGRRPGLLAEAPGAARDSHGAEAARRGSSLPAGRRAPKLLAALRPLASTAARRAAALLAWVAALRELRPDLAAAAAAESAAEAFAHVLPGPAASAALGAFPALVSPDDWAVAGLAACVLVYWLGDALVQARPAAGAPRAAALGPALRLQAPVLVLAAAELALWRAAGLLPGSWSGGWRTAATLAADVALVMAVAPWAMVAAWGARPLGRADKEALARAELAANGVGVNRVLLWPDRVVRATTAGVVGVFPGCRYLLISRALLDVLSTEELRAVVAHEAGHLKRRHALYFVVALMAFAQGFQLLLAGADLARLASLWNPPEWLPLAAGLGGLALFLRFGVGFLSRNFERQADANSFERAGAEPLRQALVKVGWLNGIDPDTDNWHHYGIRRRLEFLRDCASDPGAPRAHDRRVAAIKAGCVALLAVMAAAAAAASDEGLYLAAARAGMLREAPEGLRAAGPAAVDRAATLADLHQARGEAAEAERWYRAALEADPAHARALNNLAWMIATRGGPPAAMAEARALAERAVAADSAPHAWDTVAEARAAAGDTDGAGSAAGIALELALSAPPGSLGHPDGLKYYQDRAARFGAPDPRAASFGAPDPRAAQPSPTGAPTESAAGNEPPRHPMGAAPDAARGALPGAGEAPPLESRPAEAPPELSPPVWSPPVWKPPVEKPPLDANPPARAG